MLRGTLAQAQLFNDLSFSDHGVNSSDGSARITKRICVRELPRRLLKTKVHQRAFLLKQLSIEFVAIQFSYFCNVHLIEIRDVLINQSSLKARPPSKQS